MTSQIVYMLLLDAMLSGRVLLLDAMLSPAARKRYPAAAVGRPQEVNILLLVAANCRRVRLLYVTQKTRNQQLLLMAATYR